MIQGSWHRAGRVLIATVPWLWMTVAQAGDWFWIDAKGPSADQQERDWN